MENEKNAPTEPKKVVYLWGAGATQAEADFLWAQVVNLLMLDGDRGEGISTRILKRKDDDRKAFLAEDLGVDIEKLISLLTASGVDAFAKLASSLREDYF